MVQKLWPFHWRGGVCLLVELHQEGSASAACAADLFLMKTILGVKKWTFLGSIFFILDAIAESIIDLRGLMVSRIERRLHLFTSQPITRNALQCNGKGSFCYGQRNIFMGSSLEKRTVTALARRWETSPTCTAPAAWRTPCWRGPGCPPAHLPASSSWWISSFILCIFSRYKSSVCGLV